MSVIQIIEKFLDMTILDRNALYLHNYDIEMKLVEYGKSLGKLHTAETYLRAFREIREKNLFSTKYKIEEIKVPQKRTKLFKITKV